MNDKLIVLLDMDGVLVDWHGAVASLFDLDLSQVDLPKPWPYSIEAHVNNAWSNVNGTELALDYETMWGHVNVATEQMDFWSNCDPYDNARELVEGIKDLGLLNNTYVSTSPGLHPLAFSQKVRWMKNYFPEIPTVRMMLGPAKWLMATHNKILIDDHDGNIDSFISAGGRGIVYPQPWNSAYAQDHGNKVTQVLNTLHLMGRQSYHL